MSALDEAQDALVHRLTTGAASDEAERRFAASLLDKRRHELEAAIPLTLRVAPDVGARYRAWLARNPVGHGDRALGPGLSEGLRALDALRAGLGDPPWAGDLLAWELLGRASRADGVERRLNAGWAVHEAAEAIAAGYAPDPTPGARAYRFSSRAPRPALAPAPHAVHRPLFGIGWRGEPADVDVVEVIPDWFFADPAGIERLAARWPVVLHDVGCSVATAERDPARLRRLRDLVRRSGALLFSDHLALTRSPSGVELGHLCPVFPTREQVGVVVDRVRELQDVLGVPVALENIAAPFRLPGERDAEAVMSEVVDATGCGLLVDLTNALYDARNFGVEPWDLLSRLPLHAAVQAHLAGGRQTPRGWIDTHEAPVEDESFALLARLRGISPLLAVIVERDANLPAASVLADEARTAQRAWNAARPEMPGVLPYPRKV